MGNFLTTIRRHVGRFWAVWEEVDDESGGIVINLSHKRFHLFLLPEEFSDLVEVINKSAYGILGKKGLLMGKTPKNDD